MEAAFLGKYFLAACGSPCSFLQGSGKIWAGTQHVVLPLLPLGSSWGMLELPAFALL